MMNLRCKAFCISLVFFTLLFSSSLTFIPNAFSYTCNPNNYPDPPDPCDPVPEPDCEESYCQSFCFECEWFNCDPASNDYWEVCCDNGAGSGYCKMAVADCPGDVGCCASPNCDPENGNCPIMGSTIASGALGAAIEEEGCCLGFWSFKNYNSIPPCQVVINFLPDPQNGKDAIPHFCVSCCDKVTTRFFAYASPYILGDPYHADCASIHDCFTWDYCDWWNPECGEVGIAEVEEEQCCGCEAT